MATFTANVKGLYVVPIPLSANLTNITLNGAFDGQQVVLEFQQNATGGWTVASSSITGLQQPVSTALTNSFQLFIYNAGLSTWQAFGGAGSTGVTSLNSQTGAVSLVTGAGLSVSSTGGVITLTNTGALTSVTPWLDIQDYGGIPKIGSTAVETTSVTTNGTATVALGAAKHFVNGEGVVIWEGGPATALTSAPVAPTITCPAISGSGPSGAQQSIIYQLVAYDNAGGLSPAGSQGTIATAPGIFGPPQVVVSSITQTSNVVTVNLASPLNNTVVAGMTLHISGFVGFSIATAVPHSGAAGSGYAMGDTVAVVQSGAFGSVLTVAAVSGGVPTSYTVTNGGAGYNVTSNLATTTLTGAGVGAHVDLTNTGILGGSALFNGIWSIASAPSTSQVTFALTGNFGAGVTNAAQRGRVSNSALIVAISRSAVGVLTITTAQPHNFVINNGTNPTLVTIQDVTPLDLNGTFVMITGTTGSTIVCQTGNFAAETGVVNANGLTSAPTATVWEFTTVTCPTLAAAQAGTVGWYVYSDSASPGGTISLIGKVMPGEHHFVDWGNFYGGGYVAPGYVPTTPPGSAQPQLFRSTIVSGGGSTALVLVDIPPQTLTSTILHDDSSALSAAISAAAAASVHATINFTPPANIVSISSPFYCLNYPVTYPMQLNLFCGAGMVANETLTMAGFTQISSPLGSTTTQEGTFSSTANSVWQGLANPMMLCAQSTQVNGIYFAQGQDSVNNFHNGTIGLMFNNLYGSVSNCHFESGNSGTNIPLVFNGPTSGAYISNVTIFGTSVLGDQNVIGQSSACPPVPVVWFRASDNTAIANAGVGPQGVTIGGGYNSFAVRGILFDQQYRTTGAFNKFYISGFNWNQAQQLPAFMFWGPAFTDVTITSCQNDSSQMAALANWGGMIDVKLAGGAHAGAWPIVTGNPIYSLQVTNCSGQVIGQNVYMTNDTHVIINAGNDGLTGNNNGSITFQGQPLKLGVAGGLVFGAVPPLVITAVDAGAGSIAAGTYNVQVTQIGWDNGETGPSNTVTLTIAINHAITVNWGTINGFQGVNVYFSNARQNSSLITSGTSMTFFTLGSFGAVSTEDATGLPVLINTGSTGLLIAQTIIMPSGFFEMTATSPTMTASRTMSYGDGANSSALSVQFTTTAASSDVVTVQGATSSSHVTLTERNAIAGALKATGNTYVSATGTNTVTVTHPATAGGIFDIVVTVN